MLLKKKFLPAAILAVAFIVLFSCKNNVEKKQKLYTITNPHTHSIKIFKNDGTVVLSTIKPEEEYISVINDEMTGEPMCLSKVVMGENKEVGHYTADGKEYSYDYLSSRYILYDLDGNEIDFNCGKNGNIDFGMNNYLIYFNGTNSCAYNIVTKETKVLPYRLIGHFKKYFIMSDYLWGDQSPTENPSVEIYDQNLHLIKRIEGYAYNYVINIAGKEFIGLNIITDKESGQVSYNFLDDNFNLIFDEPIENYIGNEKTLQVVCRRNGMKFLFDFDKLKMIGDMTLDDNKEEPFDPEKRDREEAEIDKKFSDIDDNATWYYFDKFGKRFYYNSADKNYVQKDSFVLVDENKNILLTNIKEINPYVTDDYILCDFEDGSKIYDKDFNVIEDFGGKHIDVLSFSIFKLDNGKVYYTYSYNDGMALLDDKFKSMKQDFKYVGELRNDFFTYMLGFEYGLMDYNGKVLYKFSIFDNIDDEDEIPAVEYEYEDTHKVKKDPKNYPRVDGSTANMPMMAEIRAAYLGEDRVESENHVEVTTTDYAWRNLLEGKNDLLLVYEPSSETKSIIEKSNVKLKVVPIGVDALVFINNSENPVKNLTKDDLIKIYTGKATNWSAFGGDDKNIEAFQRPLNSGSQTLFLNLLMKEKAPIDAPKSYRPYGMDDLIEVLASYNHTANAIGYSVYYYAKKMYSVPDLKLIAVDGIEPNDETIASGTYPFLNEYYLVIREDVDENSETMKLFNFIQSEAGKKAIKKAGYIPR